MRGLPPVLLQINPLNLTVRLALMVLALYQVLV
jgi:hypothetical protein